MAETTTGPHTFRRLHRLRRDECAHCYLPKPSHVPDDPLMRWVTARPLPLYTWRWYLFGKES